MKQLTNELRAKGDPEWFRIRKQYLALMTRVNKRVTYDRLQNEMEKYETRIQRILKIIKNNTDSDVFETIIKDSIEQLPVRKNDLVECLQDDFDGTHLPEDQVKSFI